MRIGGKIRWISGAKSVKLLTDFPLLVKYVRGRPPCDLWLVIKSIWVLRMEGIWSVEQKKWYSESWTKWRQPQSGFTPNYVFKLPPINPFVTCERGPRGLKATGGKKRVLAKPWLMAKYGTKGSMFHFIQPLTKNVENHQLFGSWIKPHCGLNVNFTAM